MLLFMCESLQITQTHQAGEEMQLKKIFFLGVNRKVTERNEDLAQMLRAGIKNQCVPQRITQNILTEK